MRAEPAKKQDALLALIALLAVAVAGGGYLLLHRRPPAAPPSSPAATAPSQHTQKPSPAPSAAQKTAPAKANSAVAALAAPHEQAPSVAFDPKTLSPRQNARLKLQLNHFPAGLAFTVEMNGKMYLKAETGDKAALENLFVPPGVQEFRVTMRGSGVQKASNIVSAEFMANKRMTLKVELRQAAKGSSAGSAVLDPAAQIDATLKADHFF